MKEHIKKAAQKGKRCILFWTAVFLLVMLGLTWLIGLFNCQFLNWVKYVSMAAVFVGVVAGTRQLLKKHGRFCAVLCIFEVIVLVIINFYFIFVWYGKAEIAQRNDTYMIRVTHASFFAKEISYYDFTNIFIRSKQERIVEMYDDDHDGPVCTIYYDQNGEETHRESIWK